MLTYLTGIRIRMACMLLRGTTLPISEITERVGFEDITHFGRTFRRETGFSPTQYRTGG